MHTYISMQHYMFSSMYHHAYTLPGETILLIPWGTFDNEIVLIKFSTNM